MRQLFRRNPALILLAAIFVVSCEPVAPTPRAKWTPRPTATVEPEETPTPYPTSTAQPTPLTSAQLNPKSGVASDINPVIRTGGRDPLIPVFGRFPPVPVPARPANYNPLTGLNANPTSLQHRPILARIGNDQKAREQQWQAGLNAADLVFEELIDILGTQYANTRYTAIYLSNNPPLIGPIRSGRVINLQLAPMLDGALSHAGASNGTRWIYSQTPMINLDEFFNMPAYCYDKSHGYQGRLYTTGPRLREYMAQKGWDKPVPLYGFNFSPSAPAGGQAVNSIGLSQAPWPKWSVVQWKYDSPSGSYLRFTTGSQHIDNSYAVTAKWGNGADCIPSGAQTQSQIRSNNVVVLYAKHEKTNIIEDSNNAVSVMITLTGQGDAIFFRDGQMIRGKWQRKSEQEFFSFTDASGSSYGLKPGNTWFEIAPIGYSIDLK